MTEVPGRWTNGLLASSYVALTDVTPTMAPRLLTALERARIAAYLAEIADDPQRLSDAEPRLRLYVAAAERADARTIVASVVRTAGEGTTDAGTTDAGTANDDTAISSSTDSPTALDPSADPLFGIDADAEFARLVADWHVDTHTAIRNAEKELTREDEDWRLRLNTPPVDDDSPTWLDDDHYVPPTPPPLPRPTGPIMLGLLLVLVSILLLAFGNELGMAFQLSLFLAVAGIITATVLFVLRLREHRDEDDDGAVL